MGRGRERRSEGEVCRHTRTYESKGYKSNLEDIEPCTISVSTWNDFGFYFGTYTALTYHGSGDVLNILDPQSTFLEAGCPAHIPPLTPTGMEYGEDTHQNRDSY